MRVLVIFAHPDLDSLNGQLFRASIENLEKNGHSVDKIDLYRDNFNPVLSLQERGSYFDASNRAPEVHRYAEKLAQADALILCFPTWCLGPPAILKGFFDRVMKPGVSFRIDGMGDLYPNLKNIKRVVSIVTYGRSRPILYWFGDPPRRMMTRYIRWFISKSAKVSYYGLYNLHKPNLKKIKNFQHRVLSEIDRL